MGIGSPKPRQAPWHIFVYYYEVVLGSNIGLKLSRHYAVGRLHQRIHLVSILRNAKIMKQYALRNDLVEFS